MKKIPLFFAVFFILIMPLQAQQWIQIGADIDGEAAEDYSGISVSLSSDGTVMAIGAHGNDGNALFSGHVRIYQYQGGIWTQIGSDIDGEEEFDLSGKSVSLNSDGSVVAIGAERNDGNGFNSGHVRVYENQGGTWVQKGIDIDGEAVSDEFGSSVALSSDGSVLAAGAAWNDGNGTNSGHVRIYQYQGGTWTQVGSDINGEEAYDISGWSVSLSSDGSIVAIGAPGNDVNGYASGHVRVYENQSGIWTQIGDDIDGETPEEESGWSVSLSSDGSIIAIGAYKNNGNGSHSGQVRVYQNQSGSWTQIGSGIDGEAAGDWLGYSVKLSSNGTIVAIGAVGNDGNGSGSGHVRVYKNISGNWTQIEDDIDGEAPGDSSGHSVSLSSDGSTVAIGAIYNDGNGSDSGHVRVYSNSNLSVSTIFDQPIISVYPNPTKGILSVNGGAIQKIEIIDKLGRTLITVKNKNIINLSGSAKGTYFIKVYTDKGVAITKVLLK